MALSLDGSNRGVNTTGILNVSLTCTLPNNIIVVCVEANGGPIVAVTAPGLSFTQRVSVGGPTFPMDMWWAPSAGIFNNTISVQQTGTSFIVVDVFGVNGAFNISAPFDSNPGLPGTSASAYLSISTTTAHCFIFGATRDTNVTVDNGAGYTRIRGGVPDGSVNLCSEYQIVSAPQSSLPVTYSSTTATNGTFVDAITGDTTTPVNLMGSILM